MQTGVRGQLLIKACLFLSLIFLQVFTKCPQALLAILIAPSAARPSGQNPDSGGYADLWNLQTLTIPSLTFATTIVHFLKPHATALSDLTFADVLCPVH